ncbi:MAG: hypothetical protein ACQEXQ_22160 [Bacillota bacterium]
MRATILIHQKIRRIRGLEQYAYQVAHFILQDEVLAAEAAKAALLELSQVDKLLEESVEELRSRTKKLTISLRLQ